MVIALVSRSECAMQLSCNFHSKQIPAQPQLPQRPPTNSRTGAQKQNGWPKMIAISLSILTVFLVLCLIILAYVVWGKCGLLSVNYAEKEGEQTYIVLF